MQEVYESNSPYFKLAINCNISWQKSLKLFRKICKISGEILAFQGIFAKYLLSFDTIISNMANLKCGELLPQTLYNVISY